MSAVRLHPPRLVAPLAFLAAALSAPLARAQGQDPVAAKVFYVEGRDLMAAGKYDAACPKLEAATKLSPGSAAFLALADCYEHTGRPASAWAQYGEAATAAERAGRADDEATAHKKQIALESKLPKLVVRVAHPSPGLVVMRDGVPIDADLLGAAIPVDPGTHKLSAEGPGRGPWSTSVDVTVPGKMVTVDVPDAAAAMPAAAPAPAAAPPVRGAAPVVAAPPTPDTSSPSSSYWTGRRTVGVVVAGVGVVGLGVGGVLGLLAKGKFNTASGEVDPARATDSESAVSLGNLATGVVIGGAVAAAAGVVVWLTAPSSSVQVGANAGQVLVSGRF